MKHAFNFPYERGELMNPIWCKDFLRFAPEGIQPECDFNYLLNQAEAHTYFKKYFIQQQTNIILSYLQMLCEQHKKACLGNNGDRKYKIKGYFITRKEGKNGWSERDSYAGNTRFILEKINTAHPATDIIDIRDNSFSKFLLEEEDIKNNLQWIGYRFIIQKKNTLKILINLTIDNSLFQIKKQVVFLRIGNFYCVHPKSEDYLIYQKLVCSNFAELYTKIHQFCFSLPIDILIRTLGTYYHSFINWMPFAHVNNSLVWGQINVILRLCGYQSVPHGKIDMLALVTSTTVFLKIFQEHILVYQISD